MLAQILVQQVIAKQQFFSAKLIILGSYINPRQPSGAIAGFGALPMSQNSTYSVRSEFRPRQYDETKSYYIPPSHHPINPMAYASGEPPNTAAFAYNPTFHTMFDPQHFNVGSSPLFYCGPKQAIIDEEERNDFGVSRMTQEEVAAALIEKLKTEEMKKMKDRADKEELIENKQFASEEKPKVVEKTITEPVPEKPLVVEKAVEEKHSDNLRQELINAFNKGLDGTFVFKVDSEEVKVNILEIEKILILFLGLQDVFCRSIQSFYRFDAF